MEEVMRSRFIREHGNPNDMVIEPGKAYHVPSLQAKEKFGLSDPSDTTITEATLSNADTDIGRDFITASKMLYEFSKGESQQEQAAKFNTDPVPDMLFNPAKGRDLRPKSVKTFQENNVNKEPQTDQEFAQWGINHIGMLEYNLTQLSATAFDSRLQDNPQIATALFHAMSTYEKLPMFTKRGTIRLIKGLATDPLTYLGVGTLGATVAKGLSKQALKSRLKSFIGPQALLIYEGMGYGAFDDYSRQQIAINANQQEGVDPVRLGTSTAIGGAGAAVLGEAGKQVGKVAKKVFSKKKNNEGIAEVQAPTENQPGIIAFHGSGADFDRFRFDKIGTGEGAQAFGYGLYFTESEDIAKFYKKTLSDDMTSDTRYLFKGQEYERGSPEWKMLATIYNDGFSGANKLLKAFKSDLAKGEPYISADQVKRYEAIINQVSKKSEISKKQGRTYKVALAPKPDELLDYDLPLGQQNKFIKERLLKVVNEMTVDDAINLGFDPFDFGNNNKAAINAAKKEMLKDDQSVVAFLNNWAVFRGEQSTGEKLLNKHGIKGIKYKANQGVGARNVPETGANNYVIFDENLINILAKYGIVGSVGITAMGNDDGS